MSAPHEDIARRVAARLAPEFGEALPMYVERAIALGDAADEEPPQRFVNEVLVAALGNLLVTVIAFLWTLVRDERQRKQAAQSQVAGMMDGSPSGNPGRGSGGAGAGSYSSYWRCLRSRPSCVQK